MGTSRATGSQVELVDAYGRVATDLRISLTDKCSLRCSYCMPAAGLEWLDRARHRPDRIPPARTADVGDR